MTVAVMQPPVRRGNTEQILDAIGKGLQIAQGVYGLKMDMAKFDEYKGNQELNRRVMNGDEDAVKQMKNLRNASAAEDTLTQKELLELQHKGFEKVSPETVGAQEVAVRGGGKAHLLYKAPAAAPTEWSSVSMPYTKDGAVRLGTLQTTKGGGVRRLMSPDDPLAANQPDTRGPKGAPKMTETERAAADKAADGLVAIEDMTAAMSASAGDSRFSQAMGRVKIFSDTSFTESRQRYVAAIGRLASGGAINGDEKKDFLAMAPQPMDSMEIAQEKISTAYAALAARLADRGVDPTEAIKQRRELAQGAPKIRAGGGMFEAHAAPNPQPQNAPTPNTVMQNGHTYTLNPKTGKYE